MELSMEMTCPICQTGYARSLRKAGSVCGDLSQGQKRPCVGRVMPTKQYRAAEWRGFSISMEPPTGSGITFLWEELR